MTKENWKWLYDNLKKEFDELQEKYYQLKTLVKNIEKEANAVQIQTPHLTPIEKIIILKFLFSTSGLHGKRICNIIQAYNSDRHYDRKDEVNISMLTKVYISKIRTKLYSFDIYILSKPGNSNFYFMDPFDKIKLLKLNGYDPKEILNLDPETITKYQYPLVFTKKNSLRVEYDDINREVYKKTRNKSRFVGEQERPLKDVQK